MAITSITILQDNKNGNVDLLSVHNPLIFLVDVAYTTAAPDTLYAELQDEDLIVLDTFAAIPYKDSDSGNIRTFAFIASDILKAYMDELDDFESPVGTLEHVPNITRVFTLRFWAETEEVSITFTAIHAARQFGGTPYLDSIYNNDNEIYYTGEGMPVYAYFYNCNEDNILTINTETDDELAALDYDDTVFTDNDDIYFKIL